MSNIKTFKLCFCLLNSYVTYTPVFVFLELMVSLNQEMKTKSSDQSNLNFFEQYKKKLISSNSDYLGCQESALNHLYIMIHVAVDQSNHEGL